MSKPELLIGAGVQNTVRALYSQEVDSKLIQLQKTRKEFVGDITLVVFPLVKISKKSPEQTAAEMGAWLKDTIPEVSDFNVVKGFLNISLSSNYWKLLLMNARMNPFFGTINKNENARTVVIEYSSPNTNKPLHLGHIRNNLLGFSLAKILKANGHKVVMVNLVNDRGIHICKSMLAWQKWGNQTTPIKAGKKGDHLVGDFYVMFDKEYKKEIAELVAGGMTKEIAEKEAPLIKEAQELLRKWEANDADTVGLWKNMNGWVYEGFDVTYKTMGVIFDKIYYESETYLSGKEIVQKGLTDNIFFRKEDGSIWIDLTSDGLDQKLLLRGDGTSVYMTQDIGTANLRYADYKMDEMIYVVGNEQNYHFQVLKLIMQKLGYKWADLLYHMSYGMVELPEGKMKSREGTVVDADDLMHEMIDTSRQMSVELGKLDGYSDVEKENIYRIIGLGALKYFILKVDPKKNMTFDPKESIDFNGNTGPFIQYTHARIRSLLLKAAEQGITTSNGFNAKVAVNQCERELLITIQDFATAVIDAGTNFNPGAIANYTYELVKVYNQFYQENQILKHEDKDIVLFRLCVSEMVANVIRSAMDMLGIEVPERM